MVLSKRIETYQWNVTATPVEIFYIIFSNLSTIDLWHCIPICKTFRNVCKDLKLWKRIVNQESGIILKIRNESSIKDRWQYIKKLVKLSQHLYWVKRCCYYIDYAYNITFVNPLEMQQQLPITNGISMTKFLTNEIHRHFKITIKRWIQKEDGVYPIFDIYSTTSDSKVATFEKEISPRSIVTLYLEKVLKKQELISKLDEIKFSARGDLFPIIDTLLFPWASLEKITKYHTLNTSIPEIRGRGIKDTVMVFFCNQEQPNVVHRKKFQEFCKKHALLIPV